MDKIIAVMKQDNANRQQGHFQTYPTPKVNPVNQMISSPAEADNIGAAAEQEAEEIMAIAYPSGTQSPVATTDATTTQIMQTTTPTATMATTVTIAADHFDCGRTNRPASPSFTMNAAMENCPGSTTNKIQTLSSPRPWCPTIKIMPTIGTL